MTELKWTPWRLERQAAGREGCRDAETNHATENSIESACRLVISPESVWAQPLERERLWQERLAYLMGEAKAEHMLGERPVVQITCDLFSGDGLMVMGSSNNGNPSRVCNECGAWHVGHGTIPHCETSRLTTIADLLNRALSIVEKCQHLRFVHRSKCPKCKVAAADWLKATWFCDSYPKCDWSMHGPCPANLTLTQQEPSRG